MVAERSLRLVFHSSVGDNTYSNYQEASRSFWRQTVLPLVVRTAKAMSMWLSPAWGGGLELRPDLDAIEALSGERDQLWARLEKASFLTQDEKRAAAVERLRERILADLGWRRADLILRRMNSSVPALPVTRAIDLSSTQPETEA